MADESHQQPPAQIVYELRKRRDWDAAAAVIAALVGLLALCVSGYTAYLQRQQVRAQVWPFIEAGNDDNQLSLIAYSKGVGPAIVHTMQVLIDGKPQHDWNGVLDMLKVEKPRHYSQSTISPSVVSAGEHVSLIKFEDKEVWQRFRTAAIDRIGISLCYCSTLGECWLYRDSQLVGFKTSTMSVQPIERCPNLSAEETFIN